MTSNKPFIVKFYPKPTTTESRLKTLEEALEVHDNHYNNGDYHRAFGAKDCEDLIRKLLD